mmetsp:Transcript_37251/g.102436  ORF Transcript_37251/g.102436 Transcript_37251/m.102436 type:complete len:346 (-) Transcript_37251:320-1357(-)
MAWPWYIAAILRRSSRLWWWLLLGRLRLRLGRLLVRWQIKAWRGLPARLRGGCMCACRRRRSFAGSGCCAAQLHQYSAQRYVRQGPQRLGAVAIRREQFTVHRSDVVNLGLSRPFGAPVAILHEAGEAGELTERVTADGAGVVCELLEQRRDEAATHVGAQLLDHGRQLLVAAVAPLLRIVVDECCEKAHRHAFARAAALGGWNVEKDGVFLLPTGLAPVEAGASSKSQHFGLVEHAVRINVQGCERSTHEFAPLRRRRSGFVGGHNPGSHVGEQFAQQVPELAVSAVAAIIGRVVRKLREQLHVDAFSRGPPILRAQHLELLRPFLIAALETDVLGERPHLLDV